MVGDIPLSVVQSGGGVTFVWDTAGTPLSVHFAVEAVSGGSRISVAIPDGLGAERARRTATVIGAELVLLAAALGMDVDNMAHEAARMEVARFHLEVYARPGA